MSSNDFPEDLLRVIGTGYLRRIRESVTPTGGPFMACDIFAVTGKPGSRAQRRFDAIVVGKVGRRLIKQCQPAMDRGQEVMLHFCMRDVESHAFTYTKGENRGKTGTCLKSFLIRVHWIKVDGEFTYEAPKDDSGNADDSEDPADSDASEDWLP